MGVKRRKGRGSWWARCARTSSWLKPSSLSAGESGAVVSVRDQCLDKSTVQEVTEECAQFVGVVFFVRWRGSDVGIQGPTGRDHRVFQRYAKNVKKMENERRKQAVQLEEQEDDAKPEEDVKMEVDDETNSRKNIGNARDGYHQGHADVGRYQEYG